MLESIDLEIIADSSVLSLERISGMKLEEFGEIISSNVDYDIRASAKKVYKVSIKISPNMLGGILAEDLRNIAETIKQGKEYQRIMNELGKYDKYLGNWGGGQKDKEFQVGPYMEKVYGVVKGRWGFVPEDFYSNKKDRALVRVRSGIFYLLKEKFPELSFVSIGKIFKKYHATVLFAFKRFGNDLKINNPDNIEDSLFKLYKGYKSKNK